MVPECKRFKHKNTITETQQKEVKPTVIAITETHLDGNEIEIPGYKIYRQDRNQFGGGIIIAVKNQIETITMEISRMEDTHESLWIMLDNSVTKVKIGVVYMPQENTRKCKLKEAYSDLQKEIRSDPDMVQL